MNEQSIFHLISDITKQEGVSCILIGGFAVNYHKVTRQTADADFLITKDGFEKITDHLKNAGYRKDLEQENFAQFKSTKLSLMDLDFIFVNQETLEQILNESHKTRIAHQEFFIPSLNHLIALKLHSIKHNQKIRLTRDLPDIINLIRINEVNIKDEQFRRLCLKYGTKELYRLIEEAI